MSDETYGLIAILTFVFLALSALMFWSYQTDKLKLKLLKLAKELENKIEEATCDN